MDKLSVIIELVLLHQRQHLCLCVCDWLIDYDLINFAFTIQHANNREHTHTFSISWDVPSDLPLTQQMIKWCHEVVDRCPQRKRTIYTQMSWSSPTNYYSLLQELEFEVVTSP